MQWPVWFCASLHITSLAGAAWIAILLPGVALYDFGAGYFKNLLIPITSMQPTRVGRHGMLRRSI